MLAGGPQVALCTVAPPGDRVTVRSSPAAAAQGTVRPKVARCAVYRREGGGETGLRAILPALARAPQALRGGGGSRDLSGFILPAPCELPHGKAPGPGHLPSPGPTKGAGPSGMPQVKASTPRQGQVRSLPRTGPSMSKQAGRSGGSFPSHEAPVPATEQGEPLPSRSRSSTLGTPYRRAGRALEGRAPCTSSPLHQQRPPPLPC